MFKFNLGLLLILCLVLGIHCDEHDHKYDRGQPIPLYASSTGPHSNPQEIYPYYSLPFCKPEVFEYKFPSIGEAFQGIQLVKSKIKLVFGENMGKKTICPITITQEVYNQFSYAVSNQYYYTLYLDDLPIWSMIGGISPNKGEKSIPFLYSHLHFSIGYNENQITEVNVTSTSPTLLKVGNQLTWTYSVKWIKSDVTFDHRFKKYLDVDFFQHKIHWFSIFNSFMMVVFLVGLVFIILVRVLRSDLARYTKDLESNYDSGEELPDDSGWKQLHGDVFRPPGSLEVFSALYGTGWQLISLVLFVILFAIVGTFWDDRGAFLTSFIVIYCFTSIISGYISSGFYLGYGGERWKTTMLLTALFFPGTCGVIGSILNTIAIMYGSVMAVPFGFIVMILASWIFVTLPLVIFGTILGRNYTSRSTIKKINPYPAPIPKKPWYLSRITFILASGILPFGSIFIETYFVFTSFWNYKYYYVYGFMLLVYVILIIVTSCVSIVSTYFLLNSEDYRWAWTSFLSSASTALYVFLYSIYFFIAKTKMTGILQTCFYFGYTGITCLALGLICGTVGHFATSLFIRRIYRDIKTE